jgi:integrase-like protein
MRFCSAQGIDPSQVDDVVLVNFATALEADGTLKQPRMKAQTAARVWNQCSTSVPGWPQTQLSVPRYRETYTLDWSTFPESFRADAEAYLRRLGQDGDLLAEDGPPRALTGRTIRTRSYQIRQFASALVHEGVPADQISGLADLVTLPRYRSGLTFFLDRNGGASSPMIADLAYALKVIARHWVKVDEATHEAMRAICSRLGKTLPGNGMTEKNRQRLAAFDDPKGLQRLLKLPIIEMPNLARQPVTRRLAAQASYLAALAILIAAPMRIKNLAQLDLDHHLRWMHAKREPPALEILVPAHEVKNRQALHFRITGPFAAVVYTYHQHFWPRLAAPGVTALFPSLDGRPKRADTLGKQITRLVRDRVGIAFNPHLMRHLAAKISHKARPGDYESTRRLLGHASSDTTFHTYEGLEASAATEAYDRLIGDLAGRAAGEPAKAIALPRRRRKRRQRLRRLTYRKILPLEDWPEIDRLAWEMARQPGDAFSDAGGAAHWSTKNRRQIAKSYGRWLQYLKVSGQLSPQMPPVARVSEPSLRGFVSALHQDQLSSETIFSTVRNLKDALRVMAPGANLRMLQRLVARLDHERVPSRNKAQRVEDPIKLLEAGLQYIAAHGYSEQPGHHAQLRAGWALAVSSLPCSPAGPCVSAT